MTPEAQPAAFDAAARAAARQLCEAATPGPWKHDWGNCDVETEEERLEICVRGDYDNYNSDLEFIAASRTLVPKLLDALEATERERDEARSDVIAAAGEFVIEVPQPGTDMARMMVANRLLARERDTARARLAEVERELDTAIAKALEEGT